jgi:hypothetical protein
VQRNQLLLARTSGAAMWHRLEKRWQPMLLIPMQQSKSSIGSVLLECIRCVCIYIIESTERLPVVIMFVTIIKVAAATTYDTNGPRSTGFVSRCERKPMTRKEVILAKVPIQNRIDGRIITQRLPHTTQHLAISRKTQSRGALIDDIRTSMVSARSIPEAWTKTY